MNPKWLIGEENPACGSKAEVLDGSTVALTWQANGLDQAAPTSSDVNDYRVQRSDAMLPAVGTTLQAASITTTLLPNAGGATPPGARELPLHFLASKTMQCSPKHIIYTLGVLFSTKPLSTVLIASFLIVLRPFPSSGPIGEWIPGSRCKRCRSIQSLWAGRRSSMRRSNQDQRHRCCQQLPVGHTCLFLVFFLDYQRHRCCQRPPGGYPSLLFS